MDSAANQDQNILSKDARNSVTTLDVDIIHLIIDLLPTEDVKALSLVNSYLRGIVQYALCSILNVHISQGQNETICKRLASMEKGGLCKAIRTLKVTHDYDNRIEDASDVETDPCFASLSRSMPQMTGLREMGWQGPYMPTSILANLRDRPDVKLAVDIAVKYSHAACCANGILRTLQHNSNLDSLQIQHSFSTAKEAAMITKPVHDLLLTTRNVRVLKLDIFMPYDGYTTGPIPDDLCGFGFRDGERPPALEELSVVEYPFDVPGLDMPTLPGGSVSEWDYWAEHFDWSRLKKLHIFGPCDLLERLTPKFTALREISFEGGDMMSDVHLFCMDMMDALEGRRGLEAISATIDGKLDMTGIARHGPTLRKLYINQDEKEDLRRRWEDIAVDIDLLGEIRACCPFLEELGVSVYRRESWPWKWFNRLAFFQRLHTVDLWFEAGARQYKREEEPVKPLVTFCEVTTIAEYIHHVNTGVKKVVIHCGTTGSLAPARPFGHLQWLHDNSLTFESVLSRRDDANGKFDTRCLSCSDAENEWMQIMQSNNGNHSPDVVEGRFKEFRASLGGLHSVEGRRLELAWKGPKLSWAQS